MSGWPRLVRSLAATTSSDPDRELVAGFESEPERRTVQAEAATKRSKNKSQRRSRRMRMRTEVEDARGVLVLVARRGVCSAVRPRFRPPFLSPSSTLSSPREPQRAILVGLTRASRRRGCRCVARESSFTPRPHRSAVPASSQPGPAGLMPLVGLWERFGPRASHDTLLRLVATAAGSLSPSRFLSRSVPFGPTGRGTLSLSCSRCAPSGRFRGGSYELATLWCDGGGDDRVGAAPDGVYIPVQDPLQNSDQPQISSALRSTSI